ncbi:MAG: sigma-54-dependent Fis family transcriptional regulator [Calditrichia bacterium]|nr:sigma-54-dependent Fis family transcriptional regulator [Calditrichia bacterium]
MANILVVDNEERMCKIIKAALEMEDHTIDMAFSGSAAVELLESDKSYDIIITDLKMQGVDGIQVLKKAKDLPSAPEVILITAFASQQTAVEAMRSGAFDYLIKPFEMEELSLRINRIIAQKELIAENLQLKEELKSQQVQNIVGKSSKMREVYRLINKVAESDATVLILGESGTGKELVAEAIHARSNRAKQSFIAVNCAAVPETLLESELFGHEKGAFTGAIERKIGIFETADKGTLFLDEIGDVSLGIQAKLLRVLQNKEIIRVGGREKIKVDARVITATNRNLETMIEEGTFRSDLYYRINIFPLPLPPLRERKEDIPELIEHFLGRLGEKGITAQAKVMLMEYDWPGNIRELLNILERAAIVAETTIDVEHLPAIESNLNVEKGTFQIPEEGINLDEVEKNLILDALEKVEGNKTKAAELLGLTRRRLYSMMDRFGIKI